MEKQKIDKVICRRTACRVQCSKGITLVALIITIIILIILAGVALNIALGENGIIKSATEAKKETEIANEKEELSLSIISSIIKDNIDTSMSNDELQELLNNELGENRVQINSDGLTIIAEFVDSGRYYSIEDDGTIIGPVEKVSDTSPGVLAGSGTSSSPYLIESVEDFITFIEEQDDGNNYEGQYIEMACDLNLGCILSYSDYTTNLGDINGDGTEDILLIELTTNGGIKNHGGMGTGFNGTFDGTNHAISNIYIYRLSATVGVFTSNNGTIKNLDIESGYIYGRTYVGEIAKIVAIF